MQTLTHHDAVLDFFVNNTYIVSITKSAIWMWDVHTYNLACKIPNQEHAKFICDITIPYFLDEYEIVGKIKEQIKCNKQS